MARIPQHIQESLNAPVGAPLSVGAMSATARSLMGVASGVEKITSAAQGFVDDQQRIENEGDLSAGRLNMRNASANSQNKILNNKSLKPGEWEKIYATDMGSYQSAISEGNYSPAVKRQLENDYNQFYGQSRIRLVEGAMKESASRTLTALQAERNMSFLNGNQQGVVKTTEQMRGLVPDSVLNAELDLYEFKANERQIQRELTSGNPETLAELNNEAVDGTGLFSKKSEDQRKEWINKIGNAQAGVENKQSSDVRLMVEAGEISDSEEYDMMKKANPKKFDGISERREKAIKAGLGQPTNISLGLIANLNMKAAQLDQDLRKGRLTDKQWSERYGALQDEFSAINPNQNTEFDTRVLGGTINALSPNAPTKDPAKSKTKKGRNKIIRSNLGILLNKMLHDGAFSGKHKYYQDAENTTSTSTKKGWTKGPKALTDRVARNTPAEIKSMEILESVMSDIEAKKETITMPEAIKMLGDYTGEAVVPDAALLLNSNFGSQDPEALPWGQVDIDSQGGALPSKTPSDMTELRNPYN